MTRTLASLAALALAAACDPPPVHTSREKTEASHIDGSIVATGHMRGNAILFLFDVAHLPPPDGTGRPVTFAVVPGDALFGAALSVPANLGPFTAPFTFSQVPPGNYIIKGFIDSNGGTAIPGRVPDFNPWYGVTSEVNKGDVGGAAVDLATYAPKVLTLAAEPDGGMPPITDVTVSMAESSTTLVPFDRPVFKVTSLDGGYDDGVFKPKLSDPLTDKTIVLQSAPIQQGAVDERGPAVFLLHYIDANRDGAPDADRFGNVQLWPKVFVRKLADNPSMLLDENDIDHDGVIDETGIDYARLPSGKDGKPDAVVLAAGWHPADYYGVLGTPGAPNKNADNTLVTVPVTSLRLVLGTTSGPLALDALDPAAPVPLALIPPGKYAIVVMNLSGQTWRVPNELNPAIAGPAPHNGLPAVDTQAYVVDVQPP